MKAVRLWSVRNAGWLKKCYSALEGTLALFNPLLKAIGHERLDKPFATGPAVACARTVAARSNPR